MALLTSLFYLTTFNVLHSSEMLHLFLFSIYYLYYSSTACLPPPLPRTTRPHSSRLSSHSQFYLISFTGILCLFLSFLLSHQLLQEKSIRTTHLIFSECIFIVLSRYLFNLFFYFSLWPILFVYSILFNLFTYSFIEGGR